SDEQVQAVRKEKADGMTPTQLSKKYGVSRATIYNVLK
ncbi:MAG: Hin recombinase, partial [Desulfamplus sp.]|nr:Hin recombinase [Desulfamplus sp.]